MVQQIRVTRVGGSWVVEAAGRLPDGVEAISRSTLIDRASIGSVAATGLAAVKAELGSRLEQASQRLKEV